MYGIIYRTRYLDPSKTLSCDRLVGRRAVRAAPDYCPECAGGPEQCWWENGTPKRFSPNLITLAEKMGFNIERFSKITDPGIPAKQL